MSRNLYQYVLNVAKDSCGTRLGDVPASVDWVPAKEAALFQAIRSGAEVPHTPRWEIQPLWHPEKGEPSITGFRVSVLADGNVLGSEDFSITYFSALARQAAARFVEKGKLKKGDLFNYSVQAIPNQRGFEERQPPRMVVEPAEAPWPLQEEDLATLLGGSISFGDEGEPDPPLIIEFPILQAASVLTRQSGANEMGGVLIGHLCRDRTGPEAFVRVTSLVPVPTASPEPTKFTFSADSWTAVREAIAARGQGEVMVGWYHSHSFYYKTCGQGGADRIQPCDARRPCLSLEDCHLHRTVFPRAYSVALLITDAPCTGLSWSVFGWRKGQVTPRRYHVLGMPMGRLVARQQELKGVCHGT